jgi:hypothetical protein
LQNQHILHDLNALSRILRASLKNRKKVLTKFSFTGKLYVVRNVHFSTSKERLMRKLRSTLILIPVIVFVHLSCPGQALADFSVWDCPYQCHGDADCQVEGKSPPYRVSTNDLAIINTVHTGMWWPAHYPEALTYDARADFDRNFSVDDCDYAILNYWYQKTTVPGDCEKKLKFEALPVQCATANNHLNVRWIWRTYPHGSLCSGYIDPGLDHPGTLQISYSTNGGQSWNDVNTVSTGYSYDWLVPPVDSNQCILKISDLNHPGLTDTTSVFSIHTCSTLFSGDIDTNGYVNTLDLRSLAQRWLNTCGAENAWCDGADIDLSTLVDTADFSQLAFNWSLCSSPCDPNCEQ